MDMQEYVSVEDGMVTNGRISLGDIDAGDLDHYFPQGMDREQWDKVSGELKGWIDDNIHSVIQNIVNCL